MISAFQRHPTNPTVSISNIKHCATGLAMYEEDFGEMFPYVRYQASLVSVTRPYIKNDALWLTRNPKGNGWFSFNASLAGTLDTDVPNVAETPMLFDPIAKETTSYTGSKDSLHLVAFADCHAKYIKEQLWRDKQPLLSLKLKRYGKPLD
jgi:hypothetical protein